MHSLFGIKKESGCSVFWQPRHKLQATIHTHVREFLSEEQGCTKNDQDPPEVSEKVLREKERHKWPTNPWKESVFAVSGSFPLLRLLQLQEHKYQQNSNFSNSAQLSNLLFEEM